jgi:sec-independent protein translocase protein TatB
VFDLSLTKILALAVLALVIFGPKELPKLAAQAGRALRDLRRIAEGAKADLREGLGPEFQDFDFEDLNPRRFVTKHLLDEPAPNTVAAAAASGTVSSGTVSDGAALDANGAVLGGKTAVNGTKTIGIEQPPFDIDAT